MDNFVLQAIDPSLGCSVLEALIPRPDVESLRKLLGSDATDDQDLNNTYFLDPDQVRTIATQFDVPFDPISPETRLSRLNSISEIPYLVHTNYELFLMLDGKKPFAMFTISYPTEDGDDAVEVMFEPHVQSGRIVKRVVIEPFNKPIQGYRGRMYDGSRHLYYALPGEEWRIDANRILWRQLDYVAWNETMERMWGTLLGYTDAQNDWWIARLRHKGGANWGLITAYAAVGGSVLEWIRASGCHALPWDMPGLEIKLMLHGPRPDSAALQIWMDDTQSAAVVRLGLNRRFLQSREADLEDGIRFYRILPAAIPELNGSLERRIEIIEERHSRSG